jgi:hypothetical protein
VLLSTDYFHCALERFPPLPFCRTDGVEPSLASSDLVAGATVVVLEPNSDSYYVLTFHELLEYLERPSSKGPPHRRTAALSGLPWFQYLDQTSQKHINIVCLCVCV